MPKKRIRVHAYSGHRADERPVAFWWRQKKIPVKRILQQWLEESTQAGGEMRSCFLVEGEDGGIYRLCYHHQEGLWFLDQKP